jgi:hypothetical protein
MQLILLLKIKDIKYVISQYCDLHTKLIIGKTVNENFFNHFDFNVDYDSIIDISKTVVPPNVNSMISNCTLISRYKLYETIERRNQSNCVDIRDMIENSQ